MQRKHANHGLYGEKLGTTWTKPNAHYMWYLLWADLLIFELTDLVSLRRWGSMTKSLRSPSAEWASQWGKKRWVWKG